MSWVTGRKTLVNVFIVQVRKENDANPFNSIPVA